MIKKNDLLLTFFVVAIAIAIYTQFPDVNKSSISVINYIAWIALLGFVVAKAQRIYTNAFLIIFIGISAGSYLIHYMLNVFGFIDSITPYALMSAIPIIVYYISFYISGNEYQKRILDIIVMVFCIMTMIMALQIAVKFLDNFSAWTNTEIYLYDGATHKNSTSQLLGCSFVTILIYFSHDKIWKLALKISSIVVILMALLYVQSRSALVAVAIVFAISAFTQNNFKSKIISILSVASIYVFVLTTDSVVELFRQAFFIDKYSTSSGLDLNRFSTGRLVYWADTWEYFKQYPILGKGYTYCDNFYINVLASGGIIIGGAFLLVYIIRIIKNINVYRSASHTDDDIKPYRLLVSITVFYIIISVFEGFPPYGPGVASMFFWIMSGCADGIERNRLEGEK